MPAQPKTKTKTKTKSEAKAESRSPAKGSRYQPHPMLGRERGMAKRLEAATGRSLAEWLPVARKLGCATFTDCAAALAKAHGLSRMYAQWIASYAFSDEDPADYGDPERLVDALYSGSRQALRPLHEKIVDRLVGLGDDVIVTSCKTMVPAYRKYVFAELRPVDGGIEVSLALGDVAPEGRLEIDSKKNASDRVRHRVVVRAATDIDASFTKWLGAAYANGSGAIARKALPMPKDFASALRGSAKATATWQTCTPSMQREFIAWIEAAKQAETRNRRVATAIEKLAAGKKRTY